MMDTVSINPKYQARTTLSAKCEYDRLEHHLGLWAHWMRTGGMTCFKVEGGHGLQGFKHYDTEGEYERSDTKTAVIVDAIIRGLKPLEQSAVAHEYLGSAYVSSAPLEAVLALAREQVRIGINKRCLF